VIFQKSVILAVNVWIMVIILSLKNQLIGRRKSMGKLWSLLYSFSKRLDCKIYGMHTPDYKELQQYTTNLYYNNEPQSKVIKYESKCLFCGRKIVRFPDEDGWHLDSE
jgi:hypothetical protein